MSMTVERQIELDASPESVWDAVCAPETWLADEGSLDIRPGGDGVLTDDGVTRRVVVETVVVGRRLVYRWWRDDEGDASRVEITVVAGGGPTRLVVRETRLAGPTARLSAAHRWEVRLTCLAFLGALARV
ncbi:MAG: hypothetical protein QOD72_2394 [Acidimicrobiaceae bacterium]|jgi:uncharacterized protein YndB with AHSA1/START domain|nr:hypothetical protein [Acidimicrobiaceae bacterium]